MREGCKSGCFHIVWGNLMLSLTEDEFLEFTDLVHRLYHQLQKEALTASERLQSSLLM